MSGDILTVIYRGSRNEKRGGESHFLHHGSYNVRHFAVSVIKTDEKRVRGKISTLSYMTDNLVERDKVESTREEF